MKMSKKIVALAAVAAMVVTAVPVSQSLSAVKAAAFTAIAKYDFESGTGMSSSGIGGTAPSVASDTERGNVLKLADGSNSQVIPVQDPGDSKAHSYKVEVGSPSSLKFANPFKGRSLSGATIAMWVKVPTEKAAGIDSDGEVDETLAVASGLVGFVDSEERTLVHPDCTYGGHSDQKYTGRTFLGITAQPCVYFNQIHHNSISSIDVDGTMADSVGVWKYLAVSITNKEVTCYIDGQLVKGSEITKGKRFLSSDEHDNPGNEGMPFLLDFLADDMSYTFGGSKGTVTLTDATSKAQVTYGKIPSNVSGYIGFTGFSGTQAGVCIDDLAFFTKAYNASEMAALFEAAKTADGIAVDGGGSSSGSGSSSSSGSSAISAEAAAAIAASTRLVSAPEGVTIGTPVSILKDDPALADTFKSLKASLDSAIPGLVAENPDWKGLTMSNKIYMMDIPLTGRELTDGETATVEMSVPEGFDTNMIWVLRINDDGTVTKCNITSVADGKLQFVTDKLCKFAIVQMTFGNGLPKTGVVSTGIFVLVGASAVAGGTCMLKRKKED